MWRTSQLISFTVQHELDRGRWCVEHAISVNRGLTFRVVCFIKILPGDRLPPGDSGRVQDPPSETDSQPLYVVVSGDTAGWIVPCGCTSNQSGGLLRRGTYLQQLRSAGEVLYVDAGGAAAGTSAYDRAKFEAILQGELSARRCARTMWVLRKRAWAPTT